LAAPALHLKQRCRCTPAVQRKRHVIKTSTQLHLNIENAHKHTHIYVLIWQCVSFSNIEFLLCNSVCYFLNGSIRKKKNCYYIIVYRTPHEDNNLRSFDELGLYAIPRGGKIVCSRRKCDNKWNSVSRDYYNYNLYLHNLYNDSYT